MMFPPATQSSRPKEQACPFSKKPNRYKKPVDSLAIDRHWFFGGLEFFENLLNVSDKFVF